LYIVELVCEVEFRLIIKIKIGIRIRRIIPQMTAIPIKI